MTLAQYLRIIRQQWLLVMVLTLVCLGLASAYTFTRTPQYSASTQMFVKVRDNNASITQLTQGSDFTQARVKSYADVVTAPYVLNRVIKELGLSTTASRLADNVAVEIPPDTVLINVTVRDPSPQRAADIANSISTAFPLFVQVLETPNGTNENSPVTVTVTAPATPPGAPISPRVPLNLALGLLLGLGLGIGAAILRKQANTTVSGVADVERITGSIPLGVVPFDANTAKQPLVDADQHSPRAEAFRTLRTNLQFADVDNPPKVIVITSALPSEGKSTSACNIALTLAASGSSVVLVDGDLRMPTVGRYLGIDGAVGLTSVLAGRHDLRDVLVTYGRDNLTVLPSGPKPPNPSELLGSKQMMDLLTSLANHFDVVVIDAPPLLPVTDAAVLSAAADGALLVMRHGKTRHAEAERAVQTLATVNAKLLGSVLNFAPKKARRGDGYDGYGYGYGYGDSSQATYTVPTAAGPSFPGHAAAEPQPGPSAAERPVTPSFPSHAAPAEPQPAQPAAERPVTPSFPSHAAPAQPVQPAAAPAQANGHGYAPQTSQTPQAAPANGRRADHPGNAPANGRRAGAPANGQTRNGATNGYAPDGAAGYPADANGYAADANGYAAGANGGYRPGANGYQPGANGYGAGVNGYGPGVNGYTPNAAAPGDDTQRYATPPIVHPNAPEPEPFPKTQTYAQPVDDAFPDPANDDFPVPPRGTPQRSTRSRGTNKKPPRRLRRS